MRKTASVSGTYFNGQITLDKPLQTVNPIKVMLTFEEEFKSNLQLSDFSFLESQKMLKNCKTSFSDEVIEERNREI